MKEKELTLKEAEKIVDTMYQNKFVEAGVEEGNTIHLGNMDNIQFNDLENASIYLLRKEIRLREELQRKDNIINELKKWLEVKEEKETIGTFSDVLDKIKELESK